MATRTITGLYDIYDDAAQAVYDLEEAGIPARDISLVASDIEGHSKSIATTDAGVAAGAGATGAGVVGAAAGVLAGLGMLAIPGVGPVVAAGWLVAGAVGAAAGATAGAVAGGITGSFIAAGVTREEADFYAEGLRRGGTVVTVKANEQHEALAEQIIARRAVNASVRERFYRDSGWNEFNPDLPPYTQAEIDAERRRYPSRF
jgi:hypothetical protein